MRATGRIVGSAQGAWLRVDGRSVNRKVLEALIKCGACDSLGKNRATMFSWQAIPERFHDMGTVEFCMQLAEKAGVSFFPGGGFGPEGEGFVRIALVENEHRIRQAARNIKKFLARSRESMHNVIPIPQKVSR